mmetsp:Transcript_99134/g.256285  ORF Transcript_99134/g.256285 Transcript_99134/m.256285 type:complete len:263 (-) Transcript_99134:433-1221(-)
MACEIDDVVEAGRLSSAVASALVGSGVGRVASSSDGDTVSKVEFAERLPSPISADGVWASVDIEEVLWLALGLEVALVGSVVDGSFKPKLACSERLIVAIDAEEASPFAPRLEVVLENSVVGFRASFADGSLKLACPERLAFLTSASGAPEAVDGEGLPLLVLLLLAGSMESNVGFRFTFVNDNSTSIPPCLDRRSRLPSASVVGESPSAVEARSVLAALEVTLLSACSEAFSSTCDSTCEPRREDCPHCLIERDISRLVLL